MVYSYQKQLNDANTRQTTLLEQGDGSKLHRPSDSPVDYSKFIRYDESINENEQYTNNVDTAISWMRTSDAALVNMTAIQTTFKEKTVGAANDTNNATDMAAIGKEMMAEIQELISLGNTMQGDRYVFGGQRDLTKPFELSEKEVDRGLAKTLDGNQQAFFSGKDGVYKNGSLQQMLTLNGNDGKTYYLNIKNGNVYSEDFVENGYKDIVAQNATATINDVPGREAGTISGWGNTTGSTKVSDYFKNTGEIKATGRAFSETISVDGQPVTLTFATVHQQIASYTGDNNHISMVKKNGTTEPTADAVNVTGEQIFGCDIFDDPDSGNTYSGTAMLNEMLTVHNKVVSDDHGWLVTDGQTISDQAHAVTVETETYLGARQQLYNSAKTMLSTVNETITSDITDVSSTDVAKLAVRLMQEQTIYNMSLSLGGRILPKSLADYL
ncbi:putative flagellar hook-associated protein 3 [Selenomonas ruminantium subsp. lactilytica TAM6421]|uniref:Putative flagellar hook-associated protein 3 n=2 Tax=Selenomonas ruminantium TaxID=971 RepID=I0GTT7_SELRL|nr:putative flagellar hook-associated protein 3 [Selenomonas ruminantium subsp. lactilytica TAM6421]